MIKYERGKPLPLAKLPAPLQEQCRAVFDDNFFMVIYWVPGDEPQLVRHWQKDKLRYGVFAQSAVPFFLLELQPGNWLVEVSLNIKKVHAAAVDPWLNTRANALTLVLCDQDTNDVLAIRMIGVRWETSEQLKDILEQQDRLYDTPEEVDSVIASLHRKYPAGTMVRHTTMHHLKQ
jgi:hypothetical protein